MTDTEAIEQVVLDFTNSCDSAGFQNDVGTETGKPKYYRSYIPTSELQNDVPIFLLYLYQDQTKVYGDNVAKVRTIYIAGRLMNSSQDGFASSDFQTYKKKFEEEIKKSGFEINWQSDYVDTTLAADSPIYCCPYECFKEI